METKKKIQGHNWLCTLNNPECTLEEIHNKMGATWTTGQMEMGEEGTRHLQFFQNFKKNICITAYKKYDKRIHVELVKVNNGADSYCNKTETRIDGPWEYGDKPVQRNSRTDWQDIWLKAKTGRIEDIPADIRLRCYSNIKKVEKDHLVIKDSERLRGHWYYGPAGVGKSRKAREDFPDAYPKLCNKWWDGYQNQTNVIMDDIGIEHKCLGQQLKIWSDRYGCILENKGGAMASSYVNFVVTSQYSIEEIWVGDQHTIDALKRRFKVTEIPLPLYQNVSEEVGEINN